MENSVKNPAPNDAYIKHLDLWLESPAVISLTPPYRGAVAGVVENNQSRYWYSEIAGYYLSYIASRAITEKSNLHLKTLTELVINYQQEIWSATLPPPTRLYANQHFFDWRNQGIFIFDIAMLLRGLADVKQIYGETSWDGKQIAYYLTHFFSHPQQLQPVHWLCSKLIDVPIRWSTQTGAYQLKVIAALLRYATSFEKVELTCALLAVGRKLTCEFNAGNFALHNAHSICYALEGALLLQQQLPLTLTIGKAHIARLADEVFQARPSDKEVNRTDVVAQLLRLSCCQPYFNAQLATKLAKYLQASMLADGGFNFSIEPNTNTTKNTWASLFARQALEYYCQILQSGQALTLQQYGNLF